MVTVELFDIRDVERMREALAIRTRVFVDEQGVPPDEEVDVHDRSSPDAVHALVRDAGGWPIGAGRFYPLDAQRVRIGRMAIAPQARGLGAGRALLDALVARAQRVGFVTAELHAQLHALGFYRKAGFYAAGEQLLDGGILHQPMRKELASKLTE